MITPQLQAILRQLAPPAGVTVYVATDEGVKSVTGQAGGAVVLADADGQTPTMKVCDCTGSVMMLEADCPP